MTSRTLERIAWVSALLAVLAASAYLAWLNS
jgi:hypothetical protein